jgi:hypothetical protein
LICATTARSWARCAWTAGDGGFADAAAAVAPAAAAAMRSAMSRLVRTAGEARATAAHADEG